MLSDGVPMRQQEGAAADAEVVDVETVLLDGVKAEADA
jgi:hypothetical protein